MLRIGSMDNGRVIKVIYCMEGEKSTKCTTTLARLMVAAILSSKTGMWISLSAYWSYNWQRRCVENSYPWQWCLTSIVVRFRLEPALKLRQRTQVHWPSNPDSCRYLIRWRSITSDHGDDAEIWPIRYKFDSLERSSDTHAMLNFSFRKRLYH